MAQSLNLTGEEKLETIFIPVISVSVRKRLVHAMGTEKKKIFGYCIITQRQNYYFLKVSITLRNFMKLFLTIVMNKYNFDVAFCWDFLFSIDFKLSALHRYVPAPGQTPKECLRQCALVWWQQRQQHLWHLGLQRPGTGLHCKYLRGQLIFVKCPELTTSPHWTQWFGQSFMS